MLGLKKAVVIEVADSVLQLVAVRQGLRGFEAPVWMTIDGFRERDPLALGPEITDFYRRAKIDKAHTVIALPRSSVVLRNLYFPKAVLANLENIIEYQVENYEPVDRAGLSYAYQMIDRGDNNGKLELLLAMTRRGEVEALQKLFGTLGVRPRSMLCASLGLVHLLRLENAMSAAENNLLLRTGAEEFEIFAVLRGKIRSAKRFEWIAGKARHQQWFQELDRTRAEFRLEPADLHHIYVSGSDTEAVIAELRRQNSNLHVRPLRIPAAVHSRMPASDFQVMAAAIGTAILSMDRAGLTMNLMGHTETPERPRWMWAPTYALCGLGLLMAGAWGVRPYLQQSQYLRLLNEGIRTLKPQVDRVERLQTEKSQWQQKASVLETLEGHDARNLEALRELSEILPDTTWINEFNLRGDGIEISGYADNATALVPLIEKSPLFQDAALASGITRNQEGKEMFRIRAKFEF